MRYILLITAIAYYSLVSCGQTSLAKKFNYELSDEQWKQKLTEEQYYVLREKGTEIPFSGKYWDNKVKGKYICAGCGHALFLSDKKYRSGTGWPSFYDVIQNGVGLGTDNNLGYSRNEVYCANCGGHLGHVFEDGPKPTGLRYCVNSVAMEFVP